MSGGSIPFHVEQGNSFLLGYGICGQAPVTTGSGPDYTHDFTLAQNNQHSSVTVSHTDPTTGDKQSALGMFNTINLNATPENYVQAEVELMASKPADGTFTPSYVSTPNFFKPKQLTIKLADNYAGLGAGTEVAVANLDLAVSKNTAPYRS